MLRAPNIKFLQKILVLLLIILVHPVSYTHLARYLKMKIKSKEFWIEIIHFPVVKKHKVASNHLSDSYQPRV